MSETENTQGSPWTSVRYFSSFEEAQQLRESLRKEDTSGLLQVKVKRCGEGGANYVVKTRQNAQMLALESALSEELEVHKAKTTKRVRKTKT